MSIFYYKWIYVSFFIYIDLTSGNRDKAESFLLRVSKFYIKFLLWFGLDSYNMVLVTLWNTTFLGMVTAEMFQSLHKKDVMQKMTENFDEVGKALSLHALFI